MNWLKRLIEKFILVIFDKMTSKWILLINDIGSTHIITPDKFVQDISQLDKDNSRIESVIPPYTGSVHDSVKAINNDQKPPPRIASSTNPMPQKSHKLLRKW